MHGEIEKEFLMSYLRKTVKEINQQFKSFHAFIDNSGMYPALVIKRKE